MKELIEAEVHIFQKHGQLVTTSIDVAEKFEKRHDHVLRSIRKIISDCSTGPVCKKDHGSKSPALKIADGDAPKIGGVNQCKIVPVNFATINSKEVSYLDEKNERRPMYEMTRSGFTILAMGFTGKKALEWKIKFEQTFSLMEQALLNQKNLSWQASRQQGKISRLEETDIIKEFITYATAQGSTKQHFYYKHLTNATYKALFILTDKFPGSFRDLLDNAQLSFLATAEHVAAKALQDGMAQGLFYKDIFMLAKSRLESLGKNVGVSRVAFRNPQMLITEARA